LRSRRRWRVAASRSRSMPISAGSRSKPRASAQLVDTKRKSAEARVQRPCGFAPRCAEPHAVWRGQRAAAEAGSGTRDEPQGCSW
jgi:hypothetical protein